MRILNLLFLGLSLSPGLQSHAQQQDVLRQKGVADGQTLNINTIGVKGIDAGTLLPNKKGKVAPRSTEYVFTPDWGTSFKTEEEFNWFTVIDADGNGVDGEGLTYDKWYYRSDSKCAAFYVEQSNIDDWLVTPGLNMRAGKKYILKFKTRSNSDYFPGTIEVKYGNAPSVEAMTKEVGTYEYDCTTESKIIHEEEIIPETDGVYYFGFHLIKANPLTMQYLGDIAVESVPLDGAPKAVSDMTLTPDAEGKNIARISFTLPSEDIQGNKLNSLSGVEIRNGMFTVTKITEGMQPGAKMTYTTDDLGTSDYYTFSVIPYNNIDNGKGVMDTRYIGLDTPTYPENLMLSEVNGQLKASWDASVASHDGVFFTDKVKYNVHEVVFNGSSPQVGELIATVTGETSAQLTTKTREGEQRITYLAINAENEAGQSDYYNISNEFMLGKPYDTPFIEPFNGGKPQSEHKMWLSYAKKAGWGSVYISGTPKGGFDTAPGCMDMAMQSPGDSIYFYTGKISFENVKAPKFAFAYNSSAQAGYLSAGLFKASGEFVELDVIDLKENQEDNNKWITKIYDLSQYADEDFVRVGVSMYMGKDKRTAKANYAYIDHFFVGDMPDADLDLEVSAPKKIERGGEAVLSLRINNLGSTTVPSFKLKVTAGSDIVCDKVVENPIGGMSYIIEEVKYKSDLLSTDDAIDFKVEVSCGTDNNDANNSAEATVAFDKTSKLCTTGFTATQEETSDGTRIVLKWDEAPKLRFSVDDFESYNAWDTFENTDPATEWTMFDGDKGTTWGFLDSYWHGAERKQFAFTVFNPYNYTGYGETDLFTLIGEEAGKSFIPYSGKQYLAAIYGGDMEWDEEQEGYIGTIIDADNWLISPEQDGRAQNIRFYVNNYKGLDGNYNMLDHVETYEVLYSTTDTETASFTVIGGDRKASGGEWQEVNVALPEGTKYFAIHHKSKFDIPSGTPFIFMVDDIATQIDNLPVLGYRLYRDGSLISELSTTEYVDNIKADGDYLYQLTVVYEDGEESEPVNARVSVASGIGSITSGNELQHTNIYDANGTLVGKDSTSINSLKQGLYIINGKKVTRK